LLSLAITQSQEHLADTWWLVSYQSYFDSKMFIISNQITYNNLFHPSCPSSRYRHRIVVQLWYKKFPACNGIRSTYSDLNER